jgi:hypothetical protein
MDITNNEIDTANIYAFTYDLNSGGSGAIVGGGGVDWTVEDNTIRNIYGAGILISVRTNNITIASNDLKELGRLSYKVGTAITRAATTATFFSVGHGYVFGDIVTISGADQPEYNGRVTVASAGANSFTYLISSAAEPVATTQTEFRATSTTAGNMTDCYAVGVQGLAGGPGLTGVSISDNTVSGCDTTAFLMESVDTFNCQKNRATDACRNGSAVSVFSTFWRVVAGAYNFTSVRGVMRNCFGQTKASSQAAFATVIAGTPSPTLASVLLGIPVVFENCDFSGPTASGFVLTPPSGDAVPVPLPLGAVRKGSVIGGLYSRACDFNQTAPYDIPVPVCNLGNKYRITGIELRNAGVDFGASPLVAEIRTASGGGGDQLVASVAVTSMTGGPGVEELVIAPQTLTATANTLVRTTTEVYIRVTTNNGGAGTCDVVVTGELYE